jgi:Leucine-rich repeat (LRR) protein
MGMPLKELTCDFDPKRDAEILRSIKTLEKINGKPAADFWKDVGAGAKPPVDDAWVKQVRALQADKQLEAVVAKLKELNPGFDGAFWKPIAPIIDHGEVEFLWFAFTDSVTDISPLRALSRLENLSFCGTSEKWGRISDLSPLKDMKMKQLFLNWTVVSDLSPLKDMKLSILCCAGTPISDLSPLKDMKLTMFHCFDSKVSDLSPLKGMPLTILDCHNTLVTDLSPLKGMPLKNLYCDFDPKRDADILHSLKTLETINGKPAAEFWKDVDAAAKAAKKDADADRKAAEYVLSIGGAVNVNGKYHEDIKVAADLPRTPFRLEAIRLKDNKQVSDAGLACFKDCENLTAVDLWGTQTGDACLAHFKNCKNLTHLILGGTQVTNAGLVDCKDWKKLGFLSLDWTSVGNPVLLHLKDCKNLEALFLSNTQVNDAGLALLNCETMTGLGLNGTQVSDEGLATLKNCKIMDFLNLKDTKVSDAGLENLKGLAALKELDLTGSKVTADGVKKLAAALPKCKIKWDGGVIEPKP